jgi:hypothetical protein
MVSDRKTAQALHALNGVLVQLRAWALQGEDNMRIASVLDIVEELPRFIGSDKNQTDEFEESLRELAGRFPEFGIGLERFLRSRAPSSW